MVNGLSEPVRVLDEFRNHFSELAKPSSSKQAYDLACRYDEMRREYKGHFLTVTSLSMLHALKALSSHLHWGKLAALMV